MDSEISYLTELQFNELLKRLESFLYQQKSIAGSKLQQGITRAQILETIKNLSLTFPEEVYQLYEWKNGLVDTEGNTIGELQLFPWGIFDPLDRAIQDYLAYSKPGYWGRKHFPIFSRAGDFLLINCKPDDSEYGCIYQYAPTLHFDEIPLQYKSLSDLLKMVVECFEAGAYSFVDGVLEDNYDLSDPIVDRYIVNQ